MAKKIGLAALIAAGWAALITANPANGTEPNAPQNAPSTTTTTPACVGLPQCPPAPPDAEGNPLCFYSDGWQSSGSGIEVWYFHDPASIAKPDKVTAVVRKKDGSTESQDTNIAAGQQVHRFEFAAINQSAVAEVLFDTSNGRCFVAGPGS